MLWHERMIRHVEPGGRWTVSVLLVLSLAGPAAAAQSASAGSRIADTLSLGSGPYSRMHTKLEKTIFRVDVLMLDIWFGPDDAAQLEELANGRRYSRELAESIAAAAINSQDAFVRIEFLRDVSLEQFLDGVDENLRLVPEAGIITKSEYEMISAGLPRWFGFLEERGVHKGDQMLYRIRGDTLRTQFRASDGEILLEQTDVGPERRRAVLGSYLVRGSEFHKDLIESLFATGG